MKKFEETLTTWEKILFCIAIIFMLIGGIWTIPHIAIPVVEFPFKVYDNYKEMQFQLGSYGYVCISKNKELCDSKKSLMDRVGDLERNADIISEEKIYNK